MMSTILERQAEVSSLFKRMNKNNQMQHAYIFEGVTGVGKYEMAKWVAQLQYCQNPTEEGGACLKCNQCLRIEAEEHPDVVTLRPDGATIKVGQVRQIKEDFSKSGMESRKKILIVQEMDKITTSAANSLLKFIEEPEGEITIMLLTTEVQKLLPTILSRCQIIHFPVRNVEDRVADIVAKGIPRESATVLAYLTQDTNFAKEIHESEDFQKSLQTVWQWFLLLNKNSDQAFIYVQTNLMALVTNRESSELILDLLIILYRDLMGLCFEQERLIAFSKYEAQLQALATSSMANNIAEILSIILESQKKLSSYVAGQGIFEQIALKMKKYENRI